MALNASITFLFTVLAVLGCDRPATPVAPRPQTLWTTSGEGGIPTYQNFYTTFDKYPDYAIATYEINEQYDAGKDMEHLADAVRLCRGDFGNAWRTRSIERWDGRTSRAAPFKPCFVVIALKNRADHKGESTFAGSYRAAWLMAAGDLFDETKSVGALSKQAVMDREPFAFDPPPDPQQGWSPSERYHWRIIERHMAASTQPTQPAGP
jgi:hypothetical protein